MSQSHTFKHIFLWGDYYVKCFVNLFARHFVKILNHRHHQKKKKKRPDNFQKLSVQKEKQRQWDEALGVKEMRRMMEWESMLPQRDTHFPFLENGTCSHKQDGKRACLFFNPVSAHLFMNVLMYHWGWVTLSDRRGRRFFLVISKWCEKLHLTPATWEQIYGLLAVAWRVSTWADFRFPIFCGDSQTYRKQIELIPFCVSFRKIKWQKKYLLIIFATNAKLIKYNLDKLLSNFILKA